MVNIFKYPFFKQIFSGYISYFFVHTKYRRMTYKVLNTTESKVLVSIVQITMPVGFNPVKTKPIFFQSPLF